MTWSTRGIGHPPLLVLQAFYKQKVVVALYKNQASSILRWVIITKASFLLNVFLEFRCLSLFDLLHKIRGRIGT